jgi:hypothetical protein
MVRLHDRPADIRPDSAAKSPSVRRKAANGPSGIGDERRLS